MPQSEIYKIRRKEAGYREEPGGVPAFPYFLVLFVYAYISMKSVSTYLWTDIINSAGSYIAEQAVELSIICLPVFPGAEIINLMRFLKADQPFLFSVNAAIVQTHQK